MVLVSSSTNKGTPSARAMICAATPGGNALPPTTLATSRLALYRGEFGQIYHGDGRGGHQGRIKFGTRGDDKQRRNAGQQFDEAREQVQRRRVGPVRVLEQKQRRPHARMGADKLDQDAHRLFLGKLRRKENRAVALLMGNRKQRRDQDACRPGQGRDGRWRVLRACPAGLPRCCLGTGCSARSKEALIG